MHLQDAERWEREAERAREAATKLSGENAKAIMSEIARYYTTLAREARCVDATLPLADIRSI
jgi:uncharacterized membrane protein